MTTTRRPAESGVTEVESLARRHPSLVVLARAGWLAKGIVNGLVGILAFLIASRSAEGTSSESAGEASSSGAIAKIADSTGGSLVLWLVAAGLALYVVWRVVSILLPAERSLKSWAARAGYAVSAIIYTGLAWSAMSFTGSSSSSGETEDSKVDRFTADLMGRSGGRWLVALLGVAMIALAGYFLHRGVTASFQDELQGGRVSPIRRDQMVKLGQIGSCARAGIMGLVGFLLVRAAVKFSPDAAERLDGALRSLAETTMGTVIVAIMGIGLVVYGIYCVVSAPMQRLKGAT